MMLDLILKSRASMYLGTSNTVLTPEQLLNYKRSVIKYNYPNLEVTNPALYVQLTTPVEQLDNYSVEPIEWYQWWFETPIGPRSCSRDIGDVRLMLNAGKGDDWNDYLENAIIEYQRTFLGVVPITGYVCTETLRRLRL